MCVCVDDFADTRIHAEDFWRQEEEKQPRHKDYFLPPAPDRGKSGVLKHGDEDEKRYVWAHFFFVQDGENYIKRARFPWFADHAVYCFLSRRDRGGFFCHVLARCHTQTRSR